MTNRQCDGIEIHICIRIIALKVKLKVNRRGYRKLQRLRLV